MKDLENATYPIYDIALPEWNPRNHCDDPYAINDPSQELRTLTVQDSSQPMEKEEDVQIQIPWNIDLLYDDNKATTILNMMNSNILGNPRHQESEDHQPSKEDLSIQYEAFQLRKDQIESSLSCQDEEYQTKDPQSNSKHKNDCNHEDDTFHECNQINDHDLTSLKSFQWTRIDPEASTFYTTKEIGPEWNKVYRRITINNTNNEIVQDLQIDKEMDAAKLRGPLPPGVTQTSTTFFYRDSYENLIKKAPNSQTLKCTYQFNTNSHWQ